MLQVLSRNIDISFRNKLRYFYPYCILEQQCMGTIIFIISMNFIPNKFVRLKFTYIRRWTCYIHVGRRGCSRTTKNYYVSFVCLVRLVQNSEERRWARSYEIHQQRNAILEWKAHVNLKRNLFSPCQNSLASSFVDTLLFFVGIFSSCKL